MESAVTQEPPSPEEDPGSPAGILRLQHTAGNRSVNEWLNSSHRPPIQPKLSISQPDDPYEREADQIAEHVVQRLVTPSSLVQGKYEPAPDLQRECDDCKIPPPTPEDVEESSEESTEEQGGTAKISPKADPSGAASSPASTRAPLTGLQANLNSSRSAGQPLPGEIRQEMEEGFGVDFSRVRIHTDSQAASMSRSIHAKAFTHENRIYFNRERYDPKSKEGRLLLAHELAHVVQQTGSHPIKPKIQRAAELKQGDWAHDKIQERLRKRDTKIITEAPIPGGTRDKTEINVVGFADLYKAEGQVVSGISGQEPAESKDIAIEKNAFYKFVNMRKDWLGRAKPTPTSKTVGPKIHPRNRDKWDFSPNFPNNFQIGEIKPLFPQEFPESLLYHGSGFFQAGNYRQGFEKFVKRVYQDNPKQQKNLPTSIAGRPLILGKNQIPDAINYADFEQQHETPGGEAILRRDNKRLWMYPLKDGVYVYFLLPHPYTSQDFPARYDKQLQRLDPLLKRLREKHPKMGNSLHTKLESPQAQVVPPTRPALQKPAPGVQAKGEDWKKLSDDWQTDRRNWVKGVGTGAEKPRKFLKEEAKGVEKKAKVDEKLNVTPSTKFKEQIQGIKKVRFWSSLPGRVLGYLYFRFRGVFEKVETLFAKIKQKLKRHHDNPIDPKKSDGVFDGWKKKATKLIIKFAVIILKEMLVEAYRDFADCMNGIIEAILKKYQSIVDEAKGELIKEIEPVCCEVMSFRDKLDEEFKKHETAIAAFTGAIETIEKWREILDDVETAVRIGVQVVSCVSPPGLGCLWGLVGQLTISAGLSLLTKTDYFEDEIAKPAARALMDAIVGDSLHNFMVDILEKIPLIGPYVKDAAACARRTNVIGGNSVVGGSRVIGGNLQKLDPNDPKNAKAREEWEKEYEKEIIADLQALFEKGDGKRVTKADLQKLVEYIQSLKLSNDEIKRMFDATPRNPKTGRLNVDKVKENIEKGEVPEPEPKERKIDYDKATRSNAKLQQIMGWKPEQFIKVPGIKADSEEFADAVYDMQEALDIPADGILGDETVINFYEKNHLKKDALYKRAVEARDKKKAEKEKKGTKGGAPGEAEEPVIVLNGPDFVIKDKDKSQTIPKGVGIYLYSPTYSELVKAPKPDDREIIFQPKLVTLDIYYDNTLINRVQNVAVESLQLWKTAFVIGGGPSGIWSLVLNLKDGIQISPLIYPDQELILRQQTWSADQIP